MTNLVRNPEGLWINTNCFREEALQYKKRGFYCNDPWSSPNWVSYWKEQRRRCIEGYEVGGVRITGDHYFYLNFCPIMLVDSVNGKVTRKTNSFPHFWDSDYNYFWSRSIAKDGLGYDKEGKFNKERAIKEYENLKLRVRIHQDYLNGGYNLIVGKARRRGYSYKSASIAANNFFTKPNSTTILDAYEKKFLYPKGVFSMTLEYINFVNINTGWLMPSDVVNRADHIRASYIEYKDGVKIEKGFKSEIIAITCKDNSNANRGKDIEDLFIEEAGAFGTPGLLQKLYTVTVETATAGSFSTGMITVYGTSGDMDGGTFDYADMFNRPLAFNFLPFHNVLEDGMYDSLCGFFHPINWNMEGKYDLVGNSDLEGAKEVELAKRKKLIEHGATSTDINQRLQENPLNPSEAFSTSSKNIFPVRELNQQLVRVKGKSLQKTKGIPVEFRRREGKVTATPLLGGDSNAITSYNHVGSNKEGCPVIYEYPVDNAPKGLYKVGYDPVRQDAGTSLAGIVVYKGVHKDSLYHSVLVAEYIGRKESTDAIDQVAEYFADLYNTQIMFENEVTGVINYFRKIKRMNLLAAQPDKVITKYIKRSRVARVYGCHMNLQLKDAGERYVKDWLLTVLDHAEDGKPIRVIERIYSVRLLEELIRYDRESNFDLVSALFMCMFQVQEEVVGKEYSKKDENENVNDLLAMMDDMYKKNN